MEDFQDRKRKAFRLFSEAAVKAATLRNKPINAEELQSIAELSSSVALQIAARQVIACDEFVNEFSRLLYNAWYTAGKRSDKSAPTNDQLDEAFVNLTGHDGLDSAIDGFCRSQGYVPVTETMAVVESIRATTKTEDF